MENREKIIEKVNIWVEDNKDKRNKYHNEYVRKRKSTDIDFRILANLRLRIYHAIKDNYKSDVTINLIGCSIDKFKSHIKSKFVDNMSWDNYGEWHMDHIIPCSYFDLTDPKQQRICFNYKNLQPLWAHDNQVKYNKFREGK